MKAIAFERFGEPEVLTIQEVPLPSPEPSEVTLRTEYCGVNRLDLMLRRGQVGAPTFPKVIGSEVVGVVEAASAAAPHLKPGTRVAVAPWICCGHCRFCLTGNDSVCPEAAILGVARPGGYGSRVVVPAQNCVPIPSDLSSCDAAALTLSGLTALHMLNRASLRPGETIWIRAASSGVSSIAIALARLRGATVITDTTHSSKREFAESLGAHETLILDSPSSVAVALQSLEHRCDVVFDHVGGPNWKADLVAMNANGRYVTCGATAGGEVPLDLVDLYYNQHTIIGARGGGRHELIELLALAAAKRIKPVIDRVEPFDRAVDAHRRIENGEQCGKIVLAFA